MGARSVRQQLFRRKPVSTMVAETGAGDGGTEGALARRIGPLQLMAFGIGIGALGNLVGTAVTGTDLVWDISFVHALEIMFANVLGLMIGFMLGVLIRNSAGAIVAYFVYSLMLPTLAMLLASSQEWFRDLQPWVDFNFAQGALFNGDLTGEQWANLAVSGVIWLVAPLAVGLALVMRSEVK